MNRKLNGARTFVFSPNISALVRVATLVAILISVVTFADHGFWNRVQAVEPSFTLPDPTVDTPLAATKGKDSAVLAGGCFWGVQEVFLHVKGVKDAISGYSGGSVKSPEYQQVSAGTTGHAESVKITFDPAQISYGQLLKIFFSVVHDPTQLNRQGPDTGPQYRSMILYSNDEQKRIAEAYISQLEQARLFPRPIVTQVLPLQAFYAAEIYHQNYARFHPDDPYIAINDAPKVEHLRQQFPNLYKR